jgi:hypothetical protein
MFEKNKSSLTGKGTTHAETRGGACGSKNGGK